MTGLDGRLALLVLLLGLAVGGRGAWLWQANAYGQQLATQAADFATARDTAAQAAHSALEQRLQAQSGTHYKKMHDAQEARQRLATADLRLSVLTAYPAAAGLVHGAARVELAPAHAQRILAITGDGDDGLKALQACQAYVREVVGTNHSSR
ncbi:lysis protein [Pseudomonas plecoglossicida]|uniref:Lysis protein n=1 Tax=Pseudomonas plecoglossicida TaxID=70775 RepID=A0AAD0QUC3_PSEDL|nr:phage protein [Pseudomonas plecoglossicida]AXM95178.1 lysis protein [Pseudomonas plecoglossicida]EPB97014.1 phage protein [Pseudomonas plecoglossicida NB2011]QLB55926.1 lysis protein [Pseudomonas plecoglossicida]